MYREKMIDTLSNYCDELADQYLQCDLDSIDSLVIDAAVRKAIAS
jgi:hypothetical protein